MEKIWTVTENGITYNYGDKGIHIKDARVDNERGFLRVLYYDHEGMKVANISTGIIADLLRENTKRR